MTPSAVIVPHTHSSLRAPPKGAQSILLSARARKMKNKENTNNDKYNINFIHPNRLAEKSGISLFSKSKFISTSATPKISGNNRASHKRIPIIQAKTPIRNAAQRFVCPQNKNLDNGTAINAS